MNSRWLILAALAALLLTPLWQALWRLWRQRRRARLLTVPAEWHANLNSLCPLYRRTPPALRLRAIELALQFIDQKHFVGCNGLMVTPAMRQVIAFQACLLVAKHGLASYDDLASVLVYPGPFVVEQAHVDDAGVVTSGSAVLSGQAIDVMRVVLSWPDVLVAGRDGDGYNVVVHEFAHHLDRALDGVLSHPAHGPGWHALLEREYHALCDATDRGEETLIDPYGSEDPAEFFAVATEAFMELPRELKTRHAELYSALSRLYALDPAAW